MNCAFVIEWRDLTGWSFSAASETLISAGCHSRTYCAQVREPRATLGDSSLGQRRGSDYAGVQILATFGAISVGIKSLNREGPTTIPDSP